MKLSRVVKSTMDWYAKAFNLAFDLPSNENEGKHKKLGLWL